VQDFIDLIWEQLKNAKYFGSLLDITGELEKLKKKRKESDTLFFDETKWEETEINVLEDIKNNVKNNKEYGEYIEQGMNFAELLIQKYDVVVANPPYIGSADMKKEYKDFVKDNYKGFDKNLYAAFIKRNADFVKRNGFVGMITPQTYMFISSYDKTRNWILEKNQIIDFVHYGLGGVFSEVLVDTSIIIFKKQKEENYESIFYNLVKFERSSKTSKKDALQNAVMELKNGKECKYVHFINQNEFKKIPDSPFVYWISKEIRELFSKYNQLNDYANIVVGLQTGDNDRFLHFWWEVDQKDISQNYEIDRKKWVPYAKGGPYNKWYGNLWWVVNWENDGEEIKELVDINGKQKSRPQNESYYFKEGLNFSQTTSSALSCRYSPKNTIFDVVSSSIFSKNLSPKYYLSIINSKTTNILANVVNPTVHYQVGDLKNISIPDHSKLENITIPANQSDLVNKLNNYKPLTNNQINLETIAKDCINIKKELYSFHIMERDYKNDPLSWAVNKLAENGEVISVKSALKEFFLHKAELETRLLLNEALNDELVFKAYELMPEEQTLENIVSENYVNNSSQDTSSDKGSISAVLEVLESEGIPPGAYPQRELTDKEKEKLRKLYINHRKDRGSGKSKAINGMDFGIVGELSARLRVNPVTIFNEIKKIEYLPEKAVKDVITEHIQALVIEIMRNDNDGIMSLSTDTGEKSLPTMIREKWRDLGLGDTYNELENLLGKTIDDYLFRDFFKDHAKRFMKRPIIWHLVSEKGSFNFFVRHHSWSHDRLLLLKSKYLGEVKRTLDNTLASETDEKKRNELMDELNELEKFDKKIDKLLSSEYDPKVDDGVAKNIAPLQKEEILKTNVLSKKQMNKMLNVKW
jgi:methylase of polypeptide subunit release factors